MSNRGGHGRCGSSVHDNPVLVKGRVCGRLRKVGWHKTGDHRFAAKAVARKLGLSEVRAGLSPEVKVTDVHALRGEGHPIAMLGHGVNDAPRFGAADFGRGWAHAGVTPHLSGPSSS